MDDAADVEAENQYAEGSRHCLRQQVNSPRFKARPMPRPPEAHRDEELVAISPIVDLADVRMIDAGGSLGPSPEAHPGCSSRPSDDINLHGDEGARAVRRARHTPRPSRLRRASA
jgi:hypothetical protein